MPTASPAIATAIDLDRDTAGLARRAAAVLIDMVVLVILTTPLALPQLEQMMIAVMALDGDLFFDTLFEYDLAWWRTAGIYAVGFGYGVFMLGRYRRTLGMMVFGARVTNPDATDVGWGKAALRTAAYLMPAVAADVLLDRSELAAVLVSGVQTIGLLWIMVDGAHQGYHDKIARTLVMLERRCRERERAGSIEAERTAASDSDAAA
ncbi:MAG: RDD family protein [Armatimonadota bacterium]|nr:MAG: RDD family protein [Armatimonadota bacterium]